MKEGSKNKVLREKITKRRKSRNIKKKCRGGLKPMKPAEERGGDSHF